MKRKAMTKLIAWKNAPHRKPLLLLGARQVGKTWLLNEFGKNHFAKVAYIKFDKNPRMRNIFEQDYDVQRLLTALQLEAGFKITPEDTLIVFDEIQTSPHALTSLKYFCEEAPEYAIAAAGSLLGVAEHSGTGFPVGKVDRIYLYPMTFMEFLDATGNERFSELIRSCDWTMMTAFQNNLADLLRHYYFVGGMPEVLKSFAENQDFNRVRVIQNQLLADYADDFEKHTTKNIASKIRMLWDSIPAQLSKENKKFVYSDVQKSLRAKDLDDAMSWLLASGEIYHTPKVSKPAIPLDAYRENMFKVFFLDVGLLAAKSHLSAKTLLEGNAIFQEFKGALAEQYVQQQLRAELNIEPYYWATDRVDFEIDFIVQNDMGVIPIEVKAEINLQAKSLKSYCQKFKPQLAIRTSMGKYYKQDISIPTKNESESPGSYTLIDLPLFAISQFEKVCNDIGV